MKIDCAHDKLMSIKDLILLQNPKNTNEHPKEQIDLLAKIIDFAGQRQPIVISKRSGLIITGHGTLMAMEKLGWDQAAVNFQDFATEAAEYQHMTAANEIARWSNLNIDRLHIDLEKIDLGDIHLLGIKDIDSLFGSPVEMALPELSSENPIYMQRTFSLTDDQVELVEKAMNRAKNELDCTHEINENSKSNQLIAALRFYVES